MQQQTDEPGRGNPIIGIPLTMGGALWFRRWGDFADRQGGSSRQPLNEYLANGRWNAVVASRITAISIPRCTQSVKAGEPPRRARVRRES